MIRTTSTAPSHVVACVHHGLGDFLMALPTLVAMDTAMPEGARLTVLVKSPTEADVARSVAWRRNVDVRVLVKVPGTSRISTTLRLGLALRFSNPSHYVAIHGSDTLASSAFAMLVGARHAIGHGRRWGRFGYDSLVEPRQDEHKVKFYANLGSAALSLGPLPAKTDFRFPEATLARAEELLPGTARWILIAPGSGPEECHKRWLPERYAKVIDILRHENPGMEVALIGNAAEKHVLNEISTACGSGSVHRLESIDILTALACTGRARLLLASCNGATHMAATMGTPVVGIYGPTNPKFTGPFTPRLRVVRLGYRCSPCYRLGFESGCGNPVCMTDITPEPVLAAVRAELADEPVPTMGAIETTEATTADPRLHTALDGSSGTPNR